MTTFGLISVLLSGLAMLLSLIVWNGQRKLQREANDLQKVTAELSKKQLPQINSQESDRQKARLCLELARQGNGYRLILSNAGPADAFVVDLRPTGRSVDNHPVVESELKEKFPHKRLRTGDQIRLIAGIAGDGPPVHEFHVTWKNEDGSTAMEDFTVTL